MNSELDVYLGSEAVGTLFEDGDEMSYVYRQGVSHSVSVGMPISDVRFKHKHCEAFFGGLLPEGDAARKALGTRFGISANNTFSLLRAIGAECAGALSIVEAGAPAPIEDVGDISTLSESELAQHIRELPQRPLFVGVKGIRLSLSGVQDKAAVLVSEGKIGIPAGGPTSHILKPDVQRTPGVIYCEHLCMRIASAIGLSVAPVQFGKAEDQVYLLVERYDRQRDGAHRLKRIHQEDFCQALAIPSTKKYEDDGGPTLKDCFDLLKKTAVPAKERIALLKAVIFNFLVSNRDAHAKNFSLLHSSKGVRLAPLYDIVCTEAFRDYSQRLAMSIGDYDEPTEIFAYNWRTLCEDVGYSYPAFLATARKLCNSIPGAADKELEYMRATGWGHPTCDRAAEIIKNNCTTMQARLKL